VVGYYESKVEVIKTVHIYIIINYTRLKSYLIQVSHVLKYKRDFVTKPRAKNTKNVNKISNYSTSYTTLTLMT